MLSLFRNILIAFVASFTAEFAVLAFDQATKAAAAGGLLTLLFTYVFSTLFSSALGALFAIVVVGLIWGFIRRGRMLVGSVVVFAVLFLPSILAFLPVRPDSHFTLSIGSCRVYIDSVITECGAQVRLIGALKNLVWAGIGTAAFILAEVWTSPRSRGSTVG